MFAFFFLVLYFPLNWVCFGGRVAAEKKMLGCARAISFCYHSPVSVCVWVRECVFVYSSLWESSCSAKACQFGVAMAMAAALLGKKKKHFRIENARAHTKGG